jgi:hypothetical protein
MFLNQATVNIAKIIPGMSKATIQQAISGVGSPIFHNLTSFKRQEVLGAIINSINYVFIMVTTAATVCLILSIFIKREKLFLSPAQ